MATYNVKKYNSKTDKFENFGGGYTEEDVKAITKGYKFNGFFYDRKGTKTFYMVEEDK